MYFQIIFTILLFWLGGALSQDLNGRREYKRVCYYTNWAQYRPGGGKFFPENIQPDLCTHLVYAFARLDMYKIKTLEWNDDKMYIRFNALKSRSKNLKTLIAIGGWNAGSAAFSRMVKTAGHRSQFIQSVIDFCRLHGFDGFDLDWEYPARRGGRPEDKRNLILLLKEMRAAFMREAMTKKRAPLLLTAAVPAGKLSIDAGYDIPRISSYLDFINLMTYDLHGAWEKFTGENAPLHARGAEHGDARQLNVEWAANYWVSKGAPKEKLIIGMPTYGRTFTLANSAMYGIGASVTGPGQAGKYTRENGFLSYYEICSMEEETKGKTYWDNEGKVPYFVDGRLWAGFDNVRSILLKTKWLIQQGFGGAMVWSLALDDFGKSCKSSQRPYPLISTIKDELIRAEKGFTGKPTKRMTTKMTRMTTKSRPTTQTSTPEPPYPDDDFSCVGRKTGFYPDPKSCRGFYRCDSGTASHYMCQMGLRFNPKYNVCDWPINVDCHIKFWL